MTVLVVVKEEADAAPVVRWSRTLARIRGEPLEVLALLPPGGGAEGELAAGQPAAPEAHALVRVAAEVLAESPRPLVAQDEAEPDEPVARLRWTATDEPAELALQATEELRPSVVVAAKERSERHLGVGRSPARALFLRASCHVVLLRTGGADGSRLERVLVPTGGGVHASAALRLGARIAARTGGSLTALYVQPRYGPVATEVGERLLARYLQRAGFGLDEKVLRRVVLDDDPAHGIARVAEEGFDLLLLGLSRPRTLRSWLFGALPDRLVQGEDTLAVAAFRAKASLISRTRRRVERWLDLRIPQLDREQRVALHERIQSGSRWNFDFMTLIGLSTAIAALGLVQDSAAVVIGAMLVAPLMTPLIGLGLALVQGNVPLLRRALEAVTLGFLLAVAIGALTGWVLPVAGLTGELLARGGPTLLDLGVALLSGYAAAYCLGRPGLSAALPGVAIAAALVPPIATTGISLAVGEHANARGAALLFTTNVVAIVLGAALSLWAGGLRGKPEAPRRWATAAFLAFAAAGLVLVFPLGRTWSFGEPAAPTARAAGPAEALVRAVEARLAEVDDVHLEGLSWRRDERRVELRLLAAEPLDGELVADLERIVRAAQGPATTVRLRTALGERVDLPPR